MVNTEGEGFLGGGVENIFISLGDYTIRSKVSYKLGYSPIKNEIFKYSFSRKIAVLMLSTDVQYSIN